jgi:hypothetical protein
MKKIAIIVIVSLLMSGIAPYANASIPNVMTYAGVLKDINGNALDGAYTLTVKLYETASGGVPVWSHTATGVSIDQGKFYLEFSPEVVFDKEYWLGFQVGGDSEMSPRQRLGAVPYALSSKSTVLESISIKEETPSSLIKLEKTDTNYSGEPIVDIINNSYDPAIAIRTDIQYAGAGIEIVNTQPSYSDSIYACNWNNDGSDTSNRGINIVHKGILPAAEFRQYGPGEGLSVQKGNGFGREALSISMYTNGCAAQIFQSNIGTEALYINQQASGNAALKIEQTPSHDKPYIEVGSAFKVVSNSYVKDGVALRFGTRYLWLDAQNRIRVKNGVPTKDLDGQIVGLQK